jgi:mono/diheme cytochrome c family protein
MPSRQRSIARVVFAIAATAFSAAVAAGSSPREIRQQIDAVDKLLATGKPDEAAAALAKGIAGLDALLAGPAPPQAFTLLADRATKARAKLERAGVDVAGLVVPVPGAVPGPAGGVGPLPPRRPAVAGVSFAREVAPFLVATCGRCHVSGRKGDFQMATYAQLMNSAKVSPGMGSMSELVEVMLSGEMPPGGKVAADDIGMVIRWIDAGAASDAAPNADLAAVARAAAAPPPVAAPAAAAAAPLKPGDVAFSADVAPILLEQCGNCHGERDPESNLRMTSLESLIKGGRSGPAFLPGKGNDSLLVKKLTGVGIEGQRMPLGKPPLTAEQIATISTWIDQGGRIDLLSPQAPLETLVAADRARRLSDEQLTQIRVTAAQALWRRFIPDEPPVVELRPGFGMVGNLPEARMQELADKVEELAGRVRAELGTGQAPLLKGGVILYVFRNSYDYSEFWQVVLEMERPKGVTAHAGVAGDVAYGALALPSTAEAVEDTSLLLAEQLTAAALAGRGLPAWFCRGVGRAVASRIVPKAMLVQTWKRDTGAAVKALGSLTDYFSDRADPAAAALAGGGFLGGLLGGGKLALFVAAIDGGAAFDSAFQKAFRTTPEQALMAWAAKNGGR